MENGMWFRRIHHGGTETTEMKKKYED